MSINITLIDKITLLTAKRNSGKSVLLKYLVEHEKSKFDKIFVICPTEQINRFYKDAWKKILNPSDDQIIIKKKGNRKGTSKATSKGAEKALASCKPMSVSNRKGGSNKPAVVISRGLGKKILVFCHHHRLV